jgi:predicted nucleic acid-binding protein
VIYVIDASIAVKWFAPDGNATDAAAERVLRRVIARPSGFVVPELFMYEVLSVLCRQLAQLADAKRAMQRLDRLGLRRVRPDAHLMEAATRLAYRRKLSGYDAAYAALAMEVKGRWLTLDETAHRRVDALGISELAT